MATAEKITLTTHLAIPPDRILKTISGSTAAIASENEASPRLLGKRITIVSSPPKLQNKDSQDIDKDALADLIHTIEYLLKSTTDPSTKAYLSSMLASLQSLNPADIDAEVKAFIDSLRKEIDTAISQETDPSTKALLEYLNAKMGEIADPSSTEHKNFIEFVFEMMTILLALQASLTQNSGKFAEANNETSTKLADIAKETCTRVLAKMAELKKEMDDAAMWGLFIKIGTIVLGVILTVVTYGTAGPFAAVMCAAVIAADQAGLLDKLVDKICDSLGSDNTWVRCAVKIVLCIAIGAAAGGISAAGDSMLASGAQAAARTAGKVAVDQAAAAAARGVEIEMTDFASVGAREIEDVTYGQIFKGTFSSVSKNIGIQAFFMMNPIMDLVQGVADLCCPEDSPLKKKIVMYISMAIMILTAVLAMKFAAAPAEAAAKGELTTAGGVLAKNLSKAAETSKLWGALESTMNFTRNCPYIFKALFMSVMACVAAFTFKEGQTHIEKGETLKDLGPLEGNNMIAQQLGQQTMTQMQETIQAYKNMIEGMTQGFNRWSDLPEQNKKLAEFFA